MISLKRIFIVALSLLIYSFTFSQNQVSDWVICDDHRDVAMTFNLNEKNDEILDGRNASNFTISYYETQSDAETRSNAITQEVPVSPSNDKTIFYRLEDNNNTSSFEIGSFNLKVIRTEVRMDEDFYCGNSEGYHQFKLADLDYGMLNFQHPLNDQDPAIHEVSYYLTEDDAENQVNPLDKDNWTNTIPDQQTIFVRVQRTDEYSCYHVKFFILYIARTLENPNASDETICTDKLPGAFNYDLSNKDAEILNDAGEDQFNVLYFNSEADAHSRNSEITQVNGSEFPKKIWFRMEDNMFRGCYETGSFTLDMETGIQAKEPEPFMACDIEESGSHYFDLSEKDSEIMDGQSSADYQVSYYYSMEDARNAANEIPKQNYEAAIGTNSLIAKLSSKSVGCSSMTKLEVIVSGLPKPMLDDSYFICEESSSLNIDGGDFESWEWLGTNYETIGTNRNINITEPGDYALSVSKTMNGITCQNTIFFKVENTSGIGEVDYSLSGADNNRKLKVNTLNNGNYEYSIDGINYQSSNEFTVSEGSYTVFVRDINGCEETSIQVLVPGYRTYFTPNGDGINDDWEIVVTENGTLLDVLIYDRYGKLLAQIVSGKDGWDGTHNGKPMPSDDYWFSVEYSTGEIVTGHFSLVRS